jgi:hypothetical protein
VNIKPTDHLTELSKSLRTSSATTPALILTAICAPIALLLAFFSEPPLQYFFLLAAAVPVLVTVMQILLFSFVDRDRLHNENHIENKMIIGRIEPQLGDAHRTITLPPNGNLSENPAQIEDQRDDV